MSPCERKALLTAERLLLAARECVCTAYSVIESDLDMAHPALVAIEASEEVIAEAQAAIESELRRGTMTEVVPLRPADPGTIARASAPTLAAMLGTIDGELEAVASYRARYGWMGCRFTEWWRMPTASALNILACEATLAGARS